MRASLLCCLSSPLAAKNASWGRHLIPSHPGWGGGRLDGRPQVYQVRTLSPRGRLAQSRAQALWNQANLGLKSGFVNLLLIQLGKKVLNHSELQISHLKNVENSISLAEMLRIKY